MNLDDLLRGYAFGPVTPQSRDGRMPSGEVRNPPQRPGDYLAPVSQTLADMNPVIQGMGAAEMAGDAMDAFQSGNYGQGASASVLAALGLVPSVRVPKSQTTNALLDQLSSMRTGHWRDVDVPEMENIPPQYYLDGTGKAAAMGAATLPVAGGLNAGLQGGDVGEGAASGAALALPMLGAYGLARAGGRAMGPRNQGDIDAAAGRYGNALHDAVGRQGNVNAMLLDEFRRDIDTSGGVPRLPAPDGSLPPLDDFRAQTKGWGTNRQQGYVRRGNAPTDPTEWVSPNEPARKSERDAISMRSQAEAASPTRQRIVDDERLEQAVASIRPDQVPEFLNTLSSQMGVPVDDLIASMERRGMKMSYLNWKHLQQRAPNGGGYLPLGENERGFLDALRRRDRQRPSYYPKDDNELGGF